MRKIIGVVAGITALILIWVLIADRVTPYTANARVKAYVVPIVPQVSGYVEKVHINNVDPVEGGQLLLQIDARPYEYALDAAQAELDIAVQSVGAGEASIGGAEAKVASAKTDLKNMEQQTARIFELEQKKVVSVAKGDDARAKLAAAKANLEEAEAELESIREQLGATDSENPQIRAASAKLGQALLDLEWTSVKAPTNGLVADLRVDEGTYARAGQPVMTFISIEDMWVEAYMTENNLGRIKPGAEVEIVFDMAPGRIFTGVVAGRAAGASSGQETAPGQLQKVESPRGWLRDPQRFPLIINLPDYGSSKAEGTVGLGVNSQADVIVYTGGNPIMNGLGALWIRLVAILSYAY